MNNVLFNFWLSNVFLPQIGSGRIAIIDNAAFHKSQTTGTIIEEAGCRLIFPAPYSPHLNRIKKFWTHLKKKITHFDSFELATDRTFISSSKFSFTTTEQIQ